MKIEDPYEPVSLAEVQQFEVRTGISLPDEYREFLLRSNGGRPLPNQFFIPDCQESALVHVLYGIHGMEESCSLEREFRARQDLRPEGLIPIGTDPGGNEILLETQAPGRGSVWYWDSAYFFEISNEDGNTYWVADSLNEFFAGLIPVEEFPEDDG